MEFRTVALVVTTFTSVVFFTGWISAHEERKECTASLEVVEGVVTDLGNGPDRDGLYNMMREASWEAAHPCKGQIASYYIEKGHPQTFPGEKWCAALQVNIDKGQADEGPRTQADIDLLEAEHPLEDYAEEMLDCAFDHDGKPREIDTVKNPSWHYSWVLGGDCERLAHRLNNHARKPPDQMCRHWADDSYPQAVKCRAEMDEFVRKWCLSLGRNDEDLRRCLSHSLPTYLDLEPKDKSK